MSPGDPLLVRGIANPAIIDLITTEPGHAGVNLVMIERRPWEGGRQQLEELDAKLNNYLIYVLDGHLERQYPQYAGLPVCLRLDCVEEPHASARRVLQEASRVAVENGLSFAYRVVSEAEIPSAPWEQGADEGFTASPAEPAPATPPAPAPALPFHYAADVLTALGRFGIRPTPMTPPQKVRELLQALYVFEIRECRLKQKELERFFGPQPVGAYGERVRALRARYPLLSVPIERWTQGLSS